jgi:antitoxin component YwqK of YwqJK toxin-antitoxin module
MKSFIKFGYIISVLILWEGCSRSVTIKEEQLTNDLFYFQNEKNPYTGKCLIYYPQSSHLHYIFHYKKGLLEGEFQSFFGSGKIEFSGNYKKSNFDGAWIRYDKLGHIQFKCFYENGMLTSTK